MKKAFRATPRLPRNLKTVDETMTHQFQTSGIKTSSSPFVLPSKHGDFKEKESKRSPFTASPIPITQSPKPNWKYGDGAPSPPNAPRHIEINPSTPGRPMLSNYKLLISAIPRPISLVSTLSPPGTANLAPFSYFQVVDHDPPIFVVGFSARGGERGEKDTLRNMRETGECVINVVSEGMVEAVNATSVDVPYGVSEWNLSGFSKEGSKMVKPDRVKEAVFSVEGKVRQVVELDYGKKEGEATGSLVVVEAVRFWVREDAMVGDGEGVDLEAMRPLVQLGGISYGRIKEVFELPRKSFAGEMADEGSGFRNFVEEHEKSKA